MISTVKKIMDKLDIAIETFLQSMTEAAAHHKIELMDDAISNAKSSFLRNCIASGIPNKATAKECGKQFIKYMINSL